MGGFPVGLMKRKPLFLEENRENSGKLLVIESEEILEGFYN